MEISLREQVINLRSQGKMYSEIQAILNVTIPKSTLATWCKGIKLNSEQKVRIAKIVLEKLPATRKLSLESRARRRLQMLEEIRQRHIELPNLLADSNVQKIALAILYAAEGSKSEGGGIMLGNSNPAIIRLFLFLLRQSFVIDEKRFRCTLQCRADQNTEKLQKHWSELTRIPASQFYKPQVDPRSIGKPTKKLDYLGVCRIDYFSASVFHELKQVIEMLDAEVITMTRAHSSAG